jgi:hypothetical protein
MTSSALPPTARSLGFCGRFHPQFRTPVRVNILSVVVGTVFMLVAMQVSGPAGAVFGVVLSICISTFPDVVRPFRVLVGDNGSASLGPSALHGSHSAAGWRSPRARWFACWDWSTTSTRLGAVRTERSDAVSAAVV